MLCRLKTFFFLRGLPVWDYSSVKVTGTKAKLRGDGPFDPLSLRNVTARWGFTDNMVTFADLIVLIYISCDT